MSQATVLRVLTREWMQAQASALSYERGVAYWHEGRVREINATEISVLASVQGTRLYEVRFWTRGKTFSYSCTCPFASEGSFCKHCVAVGVTVRVGVIPEVGIPPT